MTLATFLSGISGLIHSFSVNYWMFLAFEFIDATVAAGIYSAGFILGELITRGESKGRCFDVNNARINNGHVSRAAIQERYRKMRPEVRLAITNSFPL